MTGVGNTASPAPCAPWAPGPSLDLLLGRIGPADAWFARLVQAGVPQAYLAALPEGDIGPVLLSFNHHVSSECFLDDRIHRYPAHMHGGNGRQVYADTEAARAPMPAGVTGWPPRLRVALERYRGRPVAVTEAHLGCREPAHQARWFDECWHAALALRAEGHRVEAVTAWSLFGAVDW